MSYQETGLGHPSCCNWCTCVYFVLARIELAGLESRVTFSAAVIRINQALGLVVFTATMISIDRGVLRDCWASVEFLGRGLVASTYHD